MKRAEAFPGKYLNVKGLRLFPKGERIWTIRDVRKETIEPQDGAATTKNVMHFAEEEATPMVVNPTNWDVLEGAWGEESDAWIGKRIQLYIDPSVRNPSGGDPGGVRLKIPAGAPVVNPAPVQRPVQPPTNSTVKPVSLHSLVEEAEVAGMSGAAVYDMLHQEGYNTFNAQTAPIITSLVKSFIENHKANKAAAEVKEESFPPGDAAGESDIPF
jgi:hypothetical protein